MNLHEYPLPQKGQYYIVKKMWGDGRIFKIIDRDRMNIYYTDMNTGSSYPKQMTLGIFLNALKWGWIEKWDGGI